MVRAPRARAGLLGLLAGTGLLALQGAVVGQALPRGARLFDLLLLAPTLFVVFAALAVIAPLVAGGGNELFPSEQLVAYPVQARTVFAGSVLVAPLNLAWITQVLVLTTVTAAVSERGPRVGLALLTLGSFVAAATVLGQALAWVVVGFRQSRAGLAASRAFGVALVAFAATVLARGTTTAVLDHSPTRRVVIGAIAGSGGDYGTWAVTTATLLALVWAAARGGASACTWALRRTCRVTRPELAPVRRRPTRSSARGALVAVDHASVWRSTALRRGTLVIAVLPGAVAMLAHPSWVSLTLLPGLVAAGAGLLFGVNAFCLDGAGALWVASLPHRAASTLTAKLVVVAQTCLLSVALAVALAATQVRAAPSAIELLALTGSGLAACAIVVASCARLSVRSPHKADLRGPRDTPAPPVTMAVYSLRLALSTTGAGLLFAAAAASGSLGAALCAWLATAALAARSLLATAAAWRNPDVRAVVVTTVSYG